MDLPRREQLFRIFAGELLDANDAVALTAVLEDGLDANLIANACAGMGEEVVAQLAAATANQYLDSATGEALIRRGWDRHQLLPRPAAPAFVFLRWDVPTPAVSAFTIPAGTNVRSADGKQYATVAEVTFPAGATSLDDVRARAQLAGRSQVVAPNKLTSLTSVVAGAPVGLTVTNPLASAGAADAETPDDYRRRCRLEPRSRARGTRDALEFGALTVPGVIRATAFEGIDVNGRANRVAGVVVADEFTDALVRQGVSVPSYEAQSQAFARVVEQRLDDWRGWGIHVGVFVAQVVMVSLLLRLRFRAGADTERARIEATATVVRGVNELAPGATLDPATLILRLRSVTGLDVRGDEIENPAGLVVPSSPYLVLRTTSSLIQFTSQPSTGQFSVITTS
jgi:uncharacterized phage protein gp47/JayE